MFNSETSVPKTASQRLPRPVLLGAEITGFSLVFIFQRFGLRTRLTLGRQTRTGFETQALAVDWKVIPSPAPAAWKGKGLIDSGWG